MADLSVCKDCGGVEGHNAGCRWTTTPRDPTAVLQRIRAYAEFLKDPPPPPPGSMSIGPLYDVGAHAACTSIGKLLELLLAGDDAELKKALGGHGPLLKLFGLAP